MALLLSTTHAKAEPPWRSVEPEQQLIVLYDQDARDLPARAEDIVGISNPSLTTNRTAPIRQRLGNPDNARFLIDQRMDDELRRRWTIDDVEERLQRYVLLDFPTEATADAAFRRLSRDPNVLSVEHNARVELSASPSDPWFAPDFYGQSEFDYQWGTHDVLNLAGAWDITRGTTYVGLADTGIQVEHPDLQMALRPHFAKNVADPSYGIQIDELFHPFTYDDPLTTVHEDIIVAGHGTHVAGIIAANTRDPSDTASGRNPPATGTSGICWRCSLIVARIYDDGQNSHAATLADVVAVILAGAQVINMSWGWERPACQAGSGYSAACDPLSLAKQYDVVMVGASGNHSDRSHVQFPARDPMVIPVGGLQNNPPGLWQGDQAIEYDGDPDETFSSQTGPEMAQRGLLAPARDVLSTVYSGYDWNPGSRCGDSSTFNWPSVTLNFPGSAAPAGYGVCTGTSMAAPHITGIVALMRTVDPMQPSSVVRSRLLASGDNASSPNNELGYGVPDASQAVNAMLNSNPYRLTPLFALGGSCNGTLFYTVVPQMAIAAIHGTLPSGPLAACKIFPRASSVGAPVPSGTGGNYYFPVGSSSANYLARAQVWVFSTHNKRNSSVELEPLYRLSRLTNNDIQANHFYSTNFAEAQTFINSKHYRLDGIEGYVYPANLTPPSGAVRLQRASKDPANAIRFAVYPESMQKTMWAQGYRYGLQTLGWVFPNNGTRPTY